MLLLPNPSPSLCSFAITSLSNFSLVVARFPHSRSLLICAPVSTKSRFPFYSSHFLSLLLTTSSLSWQEEVVLAQVVYPKRLLRDLQRMHRKRAHGIPLDIQLVPRRRHLVGLAHIVKARRVLYVHALRLPPRALARHPIRLLIGIRKGLVANKRSRYPQAQSREHPLHFPQLQSHEELQGPA